MGNKKNVVDAFTPKKVSVFKDASLFSFFWTKKFLRHI